MDAIALKLLGLVILLIIAEAIWSAAKKKQVYNWKESLSNIAILIGNNLLRPISLAWKYLLFKLVEPLKFFDIPVTVFTVIATFFFVEFAYYWYHRLSHEIPLLWTIHHTHHSSPWMNLTTAIRLNWMGNFVAPVFFIPFIFLGFSPEVLVACLAAGLFYQFFLHTEAIGKLGFLEGVFVNTPSAHRVHHGSNEKYIDKNYGAVLIIYDRLFGTYQAETEMVKYGVTTGFIGYNPFKIIFLPLLKFLRREFDREKKIIKNRYND